MGMKNVQVFVLWFPTDFPLTVASHHAVLCHSLKLHASKWREIGQYLGFLPGELDNIQAAQLLMQNSPVSWLNAMLEKFLKGDYRRSPDVREGGATLSVLEAALSKAGFGATASQLRDDIQRQQGIHIMCVLCVQYPSLKSCHKNYIVCALYSVYH